MGLLEIFRRKPKVELPSKNAEAPHCRVLDPARNPDQARYMGILLTPRVINGTIERETSDGVWQIDYDHRDENGYPTRKFFPKVT